MAIIVASNTVATRAMHGGVSTSIKTPIAERSFGRQTSSRWRFSRKNDWIVQAIPQQAIKAMRVLSTRKMVLRRQELGWHFLLRRWASCELQGSILRELVPNGTPRPPWCLVVGHLEGGGHLHRLRPALGLGAWGPDRAQLGTKHKTRSHVGRLMPCRVSHLGLGAWPRACVRACVHAPFGLPPIA
jgi:hypothetical protein